jgi:hypothetical protein
MRCEPELLAHPSVPNIQVAETAHLLSHSVNIKLFVRYHTPPHLMETRWAPSQRFLWLYPILRSTSAVHSLPTSDDHITL